MGPNHPTPLPRLFGSLAPGGVPAAQMPDNLAGPSPRPMRAVAGRNPWAEAIGGRDDAVLIRDRDGFRALGATCTHLGAPMAKGLLVGGELRCPWHHACFDVASGHAVKAPAFDLLPSWPVAVEEGRARVTRAEPSLPPRPATGLAEGPFVIVGGGDAGYAAAASLRSRGVAASP